MPRALRTQFLSLYDAWLGKETEQEWLLYYRASRGKFATLVGMLAEEDFGSVLEIGTSEFSSLLKATRPATRVVTLNLAPQRPRWEKDQDLEYVVADVLKPPTPLPEKSFDVVVFSEVMEHLQGNPHVALDELFRLARPGGRVLLTTPNLARLNNRLKLLAGITPLERVGPPGWSGHFREYTLPEVVDCVRRAGFVVEQAGHPMYWDTMDLYLSSGVRGYDDEGRFYYHPLYRGWRRLVAMPFLAAQHALVLRVPSLRYGLVVAGRKPEDPVP